VWPYETSKAISGAANVLHNSGLSVQVPNLTRTRIWEMLRNYTAMHTSWVITNWTNGEPANYTLINSTIAPGSFLSGLGSMWIAEDGCAETAEWTDNAGGGYWYEHSTYMDNVLSTVVGIIPNASGNGTHSITIHPLQPFDETLTWWAVDGLLVDGRYVTVAWDATGERYSKGPGLTVWLDGVVAAHSATTQGAGLTVTL